MADTTLIDPLGRTCILHDHTWNGHILTSHPDMNGGREFVENAVRFPISIWISEKSPDVRIYYAREPTVGFLFAVKVHIRKGAVLTAHIIDRQKGVTREWPP